MKNKRFILYYIILPLVIILTLSNAVILFVNSNITALTFSKASLLCLQIILSLVAICSTAIFYKKAVPLYIGLLGSCWGLLDFIVYLLPDYGIAQFWPFFVILSGILLLISGLYKYKKMKFGYVIPSFTLIGMGGWYLLFSFRITKLSFLTTAAILGPAFMLLIAIVLVLFFLIQQKHKELIVKDDDIGTFDDEDIPLNKLDD